MTLNTPHLGLIYHAYTSTHHGQSTYQIWYAYLHPVEKHDGGLPQF